MLPPFWNHLTLTLTAPYPPAPPPQVNAANALCSLAAASPAVHGALVAAGCVRLMASLLVEGGGRRGEAGAGLGGCRQALSVAPHYVYGRWGTSALLQAHVADGCVGQVVFKPMLVLSGSHYVNSALGRLICRPHGPCLCPPRRRRRGACQRVRRIRDHDEGRGRAQAAAGE